MRNYLQMAIIYIARILVHVFCVFPIKRNRIIFSTHKGLAYNCNPKYIFEYMYKYYGMSYEYIWCLNNKYKIPFEYKVVCVKFLSVRYLYYLLTSKVIINNLGIEPIFVKRKNQIVINTWHGGGAYKKLRKNIELTSRSEIINIDYKRDLRAKMTDYVISSCRAFTDVYRTSIGFNISNDRFLPIGMPRNDLFFSPLKRDEIRKNINILYRISSNKIIILYAPTYRKDGKKSIHKDLLPNVKSICDAVKTRFNKECVMLCRHHIIESDLSLDGAIDVTDYQDMQELLLITDIFITDYSSSIWDYSLTNKPGFLFTPDLEEYIKTNNFHTPIELWPFPYAKTTEALCKEILNYNETEAIEKIRMHHSLLGSYEKGNATAKICNIIEDFIYK